MAEGCYRGLINVGLATNCRIVLVDKRWLSPVECLLVAYVCLLVRVCVIGWDRREEKIDEAILQDANRVKSLKGRLSVDVD